MLSYQSRLVRLLQLWRARHRHRRELAMLLKGDLKDLRIDVDLVAHEIAKWPWQGLNPHWAELDEVLLRGRTARRQKRRLREPVRFSHAARRVDGRSVLGESNPAV
jgi:hypothetical protein